MSALVHAEPEIMVPERKSIDQLQTQILQPGAQHAFGFMTHKRYFQTLGGGGSSFQTTRPVANISSQPQTPSRTAPTTAPIPRR